MGVYDNAVWDELPGKMMRPGGLDLTRRLLELAALGPGARILDLGCGRGGTAAYLAGQGYEAIGIDCSAALIERGRSDYSQLRLIVAQGERLPYEEGTIDAVIAECSLSVMETPLALREAGRVLKTGGLLLVSDVYNRSEQAQTGLEAAEVQSFWTRAQWESGWGESGLTCLHWEDCSGVWREFAAQVIWRYGSLDVLFNNCRQTVGGVVRPGYFIACAGKGRD